MSKILALLLEQLCQAVRLSQLHSTRPTFADHFGASRSLTARPSAPRNKISRKLAQNIPPPPSLAVSGQNCALAGAKRRDKLNSFARKHREKQIVTWTSSKHKDIIRNEHLSYLSYGEVTLENDIFGMYKFFYLNRTQGPSRTLISLIRKHISHITSRRYTQRITCRGLFL